MSQATIGSLYLALGRPRQCPLIVLRTQRPSQNFLKLDFCPLGLEFERQGGVELILMQYWGPSLTVLGRIVHAIGSRVLYAFPCAECKDPAVRSIDGSLDSRSDIKVCPGLPLLVLRILKRSVKIAHKSVGRYPLGIPDRPYLIRIL